MDRIGSVKRCKKCGFDGEFSVKWGVTAPAMVKKYSWPREYMDVWCPRCGWSWMELPIDYE